ncbi:dTDP-glucose 4,6-dehydratase [Streptomyces iconiensis]|uniref:dTDP-glucose 4,6-dehydratase n=1 Tax=Streptomyces iconiensis TaxID=1384038 RepID=A0ABT7A6C8_9ACTN|nr:dTDP-glucose 4,6-dehydratase [Streptomyces iconiensis]MDJ1136874.1 dTDP-glucose 4,6-dehydratase [Streptomyces iconiensis]
MRILVTGGAGFIGSHYVRGLLNGRHRGFESSHVTVVDKLTYAGSTELLPMDHPRLTFVKGDIRDAELMDDLVAGQSMAVHFAAESHVDRSLDDCGDFVTTNVLGTQRVLDACLRHRVERIVHVSTDEVYGSIENGDFHEADGLRPNSPYAASKAGSDLLARAYHRSHGLPVVVTRCSNNFGPGQYPEKIIPRFVLRLLRGESVPLYGDGLHRREWLHVDDHCRAVQRVLEAGLPGEIYNIGGGTELSNRELTDRLVALCGARPDQVRAVTDRKGHDRRYALDWSRTREELGFAPRVPFDEGLADVVRWYREHGTSVWGAGAGPGRE